MFSVIRGTAVFATGWLGLLLLGGCQNGNSDPHGQLGASDPTSSTSTTGSSVYGPNPFPNGIPGLNLVFVRRTLTGLSGPPVMAFPTPPYAIGTANVGGVLNALDPVALGIYPMYVPPRVPYGAATADFDGDGVPDIISGVYSPTNVDSSAWLYFGSLGGPFTQDPTFGSQYVDPEPAGSGAASTATGYRGRTETIVVADFNNDGAVDIFIPTYTYLDSVHDLSGLPDQFDTPGAPPNVYNAYQSYLLLNDGKGKFREAAVTAGISMHSSLSGIDAPTTDPDGTQPEGAQAVDFNRDGLIDLYVAGHLFINQGVDTNGVPHFKDMGGLTRDVLAGPAPWLPSDILPSSWLVTDEGAKFIDWSNDGNLALLLYRWNRGPGHGPRLFEFDGTRFVERTYALSNKTATCQNPPTEQTALFWSSRPFITQSGVAGINAYDLTSKGLEDVVASGDSTGNAIFYNYGCGFVEIDAGDLTRVPSAGTSVALADLDGDGKIDIFYPEIGQYGSYYNETQTNGSSFTVEVFGPNGEHNQFGRVIQVFPPGSPRIFTRVVDGGSGYRSQNQYPILVGTPFGGAHTVKVYYAPLAPCTYGGAPCQPAVLTFSIQPGQRAKAYAPSPANRGGRAVIISGP